MRSIVRQVLFWLVLLLSILLIAVSVVPRAFGFTPCSVRDDSMTPLLRKGDLVLTKPIAFADICVGDLLTFADPKTGEQFTRTVSEIWTQQQELVTQSPESDTPDPYTTAYRCVVGKVRHTIRFAAYPSVWLHSTLGKVLFGMLLITWIAVEIEAYGVSKRREKTNA